MSSARSRGPATRPPRHGAAARARTGTGAAASSATPPTPLGWRGRITGATRGRHARRGVVLVAVLAFLTVLLGSTVAAWVGQRGDIGALREKVASQERDVASLQVEQERWRDPAYVEQQARQRLKFVKPGEMSYTVLDAKPSEGNGDALAVPSASASASTLPWFTTVWESARTADAPGARR